MSTVHVLSGLWNWSEEDLALLSHACPSRCDYGLLLRNVLNQLEGAG